MTPAQFMESLKKRTPYPWMTPALIAINVLVYGVMVACGVDPMKPSVQDLLAWGGDQGIRVNEGQIWRLLTATYLHAGFIHLIANMVGLVVVGQLVERLTGSAGFLLMYTFAGLAGSIASITWNPQIVGIGASGSVFGVYGALLCYVMLRSDSIPADLIKEHSKGPLIFVAYNLVNGAIQPGIDNAAHVGGFLAGAMAGLVLSQPFPVTGRPSRLGRDSALFMIAGLILLGGLLAFSSLRGNTVDVDKVLAEVAQLEQKAINSNNAMANRMMSAKIGNNEIIGILKNEILPAGQDAASKAHMVVPSVVLQHRDRIDRYAKYLDLRVAAWQKQLQGFENDDAEPLKEFQRLWKQAESELVTLNALNAEAAKPK
jgi:rhomboid protease GluP